MIIIHPLRELVGTSPLKHTWAVMAVTDPLVASDPKRRSQLPWEPGEIALHAGVSWDMTYSACFPKFPEDHHFDSVGFAAPLM
jgi:hypothetical protein